METTTENDCETDKNNLPVSTSSPDIDTALNQESQNDNNDFGRNDVPISSSLNKKEETIRNPFDPARATQTFSHGKNPLRRPSQKDSAKQAGGAVVAGQRRSKTKASFAASKHSNHHDESRDSHDQNHPSPGAVMVGGHDILGGTTNLTDPSNIHDMDETDMLHNSNPDETTPAFMVTAQLIDGDEEANLTTEIMESKIQQELETRIMMHQKQVVLAEPMDGPKVSSSETEPANHKIFGSKRKIFFCMMVAVVMIAAGLVATAVALSSKSPAPLQQQLQSWILRGDSAMDASPFNDPTSPQSRALEWLLHDRIAIAENSVTPKVLDRYALAVLYFSTDGPNWKEDLKWLSERDVCAWNNGLAAAADDERDYANGVHCQSTKLVIHLIQAGLIGTIPWELSLLSDVFFFRLDENSLRGGIPTELGRLTSLEILNFSNNSLTGALPTELGSLSVLEEFSLNGNNLGGMLPTEFGRWTSLQRVLLRGSGLTGTLPTELGRWKALQQSSMV